METDGEDMVLTLGENKSQKRKLIYSVTRSGQRSINRRKKAEKVLRYTQLLVSPQKNAEFPKWEGERLPISEGGEPCQLRT